MAAAPPAPITVNKTYDELVADIRSQVKEEVGDEVAAQVEARMKAFRAEWEKHSESEKKREIDNAFKRAIYGTPAKAPREGVGTKAVEFMLSLRSALVKGGNSLPSSIAKASRYGDEVIASLERVEKDLLASSYAGGGILLPTPIAQDFIELLYSAMVVRQRGARALEMPEGSLSMGKMTGSAIAYWIQEGAPIPVSTEDFGSIELNAKKLGVLVPVSNDLLRRPTLPRGMDAMIQDDMIAVASRTEDAAMLRGDGSSGQPKGIKNLVASGQRFNAAAPASPTVQQINSDLHKAMFKVMGANIPGINLGWIMSVRERVFLMSLFSSDSVPVYPELLQGTLRGYPFSATNSLPINLDRGGGNTDASEIYFGDFAQFVIGETERLLVDRSADASFVDGNGNTIHSFSSDRSLMRTIHEVDCALRHNKSFAVIEQVAWGNALSAS